ncbi:MAG: DegT/DnrJ/EryC1/StrS family aminotransferase [Kiritimatiellia bacterium]|nr:DegT/DnrJ/EryC1/StrS family aminotransferase [Kiritimatiellia bacterium]
MTTPPAFKSSRYDLAVDTISEEDLEALISWLRQYPKLTMGDETRRFEQAWSKWLGVKYSVMCNSGASANLLMYAALDAAGKSGNRKVVVPATGWPTDITPAIQFGWKPIMCESDPRTFGLDPNCLEKVLKQEHPAAVVVVHVLGVPADMTSIMTLKKKYGFALLEDSCASHGSRHRGKMVGNFGDISVFSFYYGHHMSTVEGGILCTNDRELYYKLLMLRSHGWLKDLPASEANRIMRAHKVDPFHFPFTFVLPGFNLRPTDISAKIGQIQMQKLDETIRIRAENHRVYQKVLKGIIMYAPGLPGDVISSISFCAIAKSSTARKKIVRALVKGKIDTRIFTAGNLGRHPFWTDRYQPFSAPVADRLFQGGFFLPNNQSLRDTDVELICDVVCRTVGRQV